LLETQKRKSAAAGGDQADQALIDAAKATQLHAPESPIDGVVGIRQIDVGNIISPSTTNGLVVVTQINPISLISLSRDESAANPATTANDKDAARVLAYSRTIRPSSTRACSASSTTRSCRQQARSSSRQFANKAHKLWPGELVNARLLVDTRHNGLTVAASAVQQV